MASALLAASEAYTDTVVVGNTTLALSLPASSVYGLTAGVDINAAFTLGSGYLVFFMHCGFAMLSIGCVRARFAKHIAILILVDACMSGLGFYLFGYAIGFGDKTELVGTNTTNVPGINGGISTNNPFIGTRYFAMSKMPLNQFNLWLFQWTFAATACTIVSGAIAERARFESYILYSFFMASWVYPIIAHASWSASGWVGMFRQNGHLLFGTGAIDFAGSGVVHMTGGYAALAGCAVLGPRLGRFRTDGTANEFPAHNYSLFVLGVMILWFGWYGFNPGSETAIVGAGTSNAVAVAAVTTTLAPCSAAMSALMTKALLSFRETGSRHYDLMTMGNGALAGLVAITSPCSTCFPWAAICIGAVAGILYCIGSKVSVFMKWDDPLDAIAVHAWNGTWGLISPGLFAAQDLIAGAYGNIPATTFTANPLPRPHYGCFMGGDGNLLAAQLVDVLWIAGWTLGNMLPFFLILKVLGMFRVDPKDEEVGLDVSYHGGSAYSGNESTVAEANGTYGTKSDIVRIKAELEALKATVNGGPTSNPAANAKDVV